jgi:hypothetical protein
MAIEREDCSSKNKGVLEPGNYKFVVQGKPEKKETGKTHFRIWKTIVSKEGFPEREFEFTLFPWEAVGVLLALGGKRESDGSDVILIDYDKVDQQAFEADVDISEYDADEKAKDPVTGKWEKTGKKVTKEKNTFSNCVSSVPF